MNYNNPKFQNLYFNSPYPVKVLFASIYGFKQRKERYGEYFRYYLKLLKNTEYADNKTLLKELEFNREKFIEFALKNSPFYKETYVDIKNFNDYKILTKNDLRINRDKIIVKSLLDKSRMVHTSGTTGSALIFPITNECFQREYAFRAMHYSWAGIDVLKKPRIATFSGHPVAKPTKNNPPFWVYDFANNWLLFSSYHMNDENLKYYVNELLSFQPKAIHGYPSSVYLIAQAFKKYGRGLNTLKAIITASETLYDFQRKVIEDTFQVKLYNWYGNTEMCANIVECDRGRLHLKLEHSYVEILDENNNSVKPGERGRLVCTAIGNKAFPLIRYDIGDIVTLSNEYKCVCGRGGLIISSIEGRKEDFIITKDGRKIGRLDHLFKDTLGISEAQIIQQEIGKILINIVPADNFSEKDLNILKNELYVRFGNSIDYKIEKVSQIPRGPNGKFKFVISEVN